MIDMRDTTHAQISQDAGRPRANRLKRVSAAAALLAAAAIGAGATAIAQKGQSVTYVALTPAPISAMKAGSPIAIEGDIADVFGNKFIVQDPSGRALVETGRRGEDGTLVAKAEKVIVQGRFDHGFIHAVTIRHADGRTDALDPPPPTRPLPSALGLEGRPLG